jgi:hypothetical protein
VFIHLVSGYDFSVVGWVRYGGQGTLAYEFVGLTPTLRRMSGVVSPVWTLVCAQFEVALCRSLTLAGSLVGLRPVGRLNIREAVCPLLLRVLGANGIRWRSGCSVTLLVLGRTTGIVEPYATAL